MIDFLENERVAILMQRNSVPSTLCTILVDLVTHHTYHVIKKSC